MNKKSDLKTLQFVRDQIEYHEEKLAEYSEYLKYWERRVKDNEMY
jgi:hypothetical protein